MVMEWKRREAVLLKVTGPGLQSIYGFQIPMLKLFPLLLYFSQFLSNIFSIIKSWTSKQALFFFLTDVAKAQLQK